METWKKIEGFESYEVSDWGRVRRGARVLKGSPANTGYPSVCLSVGGVTKAFNIHRLVGMAFIPNPDNKPEINHKDHDILNNRLENLEWVTRSEQMLHSPSPVGVSGHRYIRERNGRWVVSINRSFATIEEAIKARDEFISSL